MVITSSQLLDLGYESDWVYFRQYLLGWSGSIFYHLLLTNSRYEMTINFVKLTLKICL